jgi:predicted N-formylglutamate amidohydrolase
MSDPSDRLLAHDEPPAFSTIGEPNASPFLIVCDHASNRLPRSLGDLGVSEAERNRHIGWDIGAAAVARGLAERLSAFTIMQNYSRLVIDCNRDPAVETSIVTISEHTEIPGNKHMNGLKRERRVVEIFAPYHARIAAELDRRRRETLPTALIAIHSFTPVYKSVARPWHAGLLFNRDARLSRLIMEALRREGGLAIGENEPYAVSDESDYTIPVHAERRGLPYAEIEIRQDLIADAGGQAEWARRLAETLDEAWRRLSSGVVEPSQKREPSCGF